MNIREQDQNGVSVFVLEGRVDSDGAVELEQALLSAVSAGKSKMVLDLAEVKYMNSAGLRILADVLTGTRERGGDLFLVAPNKKVRRVFEIIGFDNFFQIFDEVGAAVGAF